MNLKLDGDRVFFTSDTHFFHDNIIRYCKRPFQDAHEMNETLISNWNRVVGPYDVVLHLGDFSSGGHTEWSDMLDRLNGKIHLILGNHDAVSSVKSCMDRFESVSMQMLVRIDGQKIYLNHYPFLCYGGAYEGVWQLFGHVHTSPYSSGKDTPRLNMLFPFQYDVGVDNNDFAPVHFGRIKEIMSFLLA